MAKWDLFAPCMIEYNGYFDSRQLEEVLVSGLNPQPLGVAYDSGVISGFVEWLDSKRKVGLNLKPIVHPQRSLLDESAARRELEAIIEINKQYGLQVISEVIFHPGRVISGDDAFLARMRYGLAPGEASFTAEDFMQKWRQVLKAHRKLQNIGRSHGIDVIVENYPVIEYEESSLRIKPEEFAKDVRFAGSHAFPDIAQTGLLCSSRDLLRLIGSYGTACIDIEHLDQTHEYFNEHYLRVAPGRGCAKRKGMFNLLIRSGKFVKYVGATKFDAFSFIDSLAGRIPVCHLTGVTSMFYQDEGIRKLGAHMPITFPGDPNEFIVGDKIREEQNALCMIKLVKYLTALNSAGCRKAVLEIHTPEITGPARQKYMGLSKTNIESVLSWLD